MEKLASMLLEEDQLFASHPEKLLKSQLDSVECPLHEGYCFDSLCVDPEQDCPFKCIICVTDEGIHQNTLISLKQIAKTTSTTVFANFPFKDQALTQKIRKVLQNHPIIESLKRDIDTYFKGLRASVNDKIDCIEAEMIVTAQSISEMSSEILILYNQMSQKDVMKGIIMDEEKIFSDKSKEIKEFCNMIQSKQSENKQKINEAIKKVIDIQEAINFETPERIKDEILQSIEKIDMFKGDKRIINVIAAPLQMQIAPINLNKKIEDLINKIDIKLNNLTDESCQNLKEEFERIVLALQNLKILQADPINSSLSKLPENQVKIIQNFIQTLEQENKQGIIQGTNHPVNVHELLEILNGKRICVTDQYFQDIGNVFQKVSAILSLFNTRKCEIDFNLKENSMLPIPREAINLTFHQSLTSHQNSKMNLILEDIGLVISTKGLSQSQCYTNILNNQTGYKLKIIFSRPIGEIKNGCIRFGLIPSKQADSSWVLQDSLSSGFCSQQNKGADLIVRGGRITSDDLRNSIKSLEIRWCIANKQFFISDLAYQNINKVDPKLINSNEQYRFAIFFNQQLAYIDCYLIINDYQTMNPDILNIFV